MINTSSKEMNAGDGPAKVARPRAAGKVLIVDDDPRDLFLYAACLQQGGCEVRTCNSYVEGVHALEAEVFDFIVVSQGTRAFEGRRVLERAIAISRRLPVVVVARSLEMGCYMEAMQLGALDYFEKPIAPSEIVRLVTTNLRFRQAAA
jgi:DNA-binding NtrC family response regulator